MAGDQHDTILRGKYGTPVHPRLRDGLLETVDEIAKRRGLNRTQTVEWLISRGAESEKAKP